ncbi:double zinc ribbon domain-containing protein [Natronomonas amylolytica]|uniref:double zinc ribbon domain-containing protein n=1 Tax=Natronomonas amylolytica TaxID=3108498 RepID=UPI00300A97A0
MGGPDVSADELLNHIEALGVELPDGITTSAYVDFDHDLDLASVAISLELGEVLDHGERFPGVVYDPDDYEETVIVVFSDGTLFADSAGTVSVQDILEDVGNRLLELDLLEAGVGPSAEFELAPKTVPVPSEYEVPEGAGMTDGRGVVAAEHVCPDCDHELSGGENYCPTCGLNLDSGCPDCGHELRGTENYCPECGTAVAGD